jgi:hypothetical protein
VRKALRSELVYDHDSSRDTLYALHALHESNILGIGGIAKEKRFFDTIASQFKYDQDYRIYTARNINGELVCGLMLLYYKDTVEYFVPATAENWRHAQPLSGLIYLAMRDAVIERGSRYWNWGDTWLTQDGVYHFKSRWGTNDYSYQYYTRAFTNMNSLRGINKKTLLKHYPWFYTLPFSVLEE